MKKNNEQNEKGLAKEHGERANHTDEQLHELSNHIEDLAKTDPKSALMKIIGRFKR